MKLTEGYSPGSASPLVPAVILILMALGTGFLLAETRFVRSVAIILCLILFAASFLRPAIGLYLVFFSMLLSPQIVVGSLAGTTGILGRGLTLRLEDFLLIIIGFSWLANMALVKRTEIFRTTPLNKPIACYILVFLIATLWGTMEGTVKGVGGFLFVLKYFEYIIIFYMVVNHLETPEQARRLLFCLLLTCFLVCFHGLKEIPGGERISAPFEGEVGEPNTYGGYLVLLGAVAAALVEEVRGYWSRIGLILLLILIGINLVFTQSRSSYMAIIPAYLVLALLSRWRFYLITVMIGILAMGPFILPHTVKARIAHTFTQPRESGQLQVGKLKLDTSTSERLKSWKNGYEGWLKKPLMGYGTTGFTFMDAQFLRILVEAGLVGILVFLWLLYSLFRFGIAIRLNHPDPFTRALATGFIAGLVGLVVHAIGANTFIIVRIMEPFWGLTAILFVMSKVSADDIEEAEWIRKSQKDFRKY